MEKIEIAYERKISGSYMKIRTDSESCFDEKMLMKHRIPGLLSVEKCFMDGSGQFWYDISGKQSLDIFCRVKEIGQEFLEQLVHSVCDELGILEQHLVDTNCLCLAPELVFVSVRTGELLFTAIPGRDDDVADSFRELVEYLLTRVDHKDTQAVQFAYDIYEKTLEEGYCIADIQESIVQAHIAESAETSGESIMGSASDVHDVVLRAASAEREEQDQAIRKTSDLPSGMSNNLSGNYAEKQVQWYRGHGLLQGLADKVLEGWKETFRRIFLPERNVSKKNRRNASELRKRESTHMCKSEEEREWRMIYPDNEPQEENHTQTHPTICLSDYREQPEGLLLYEGYENFSDIRIEKESLQIGHSDDSDVVITKDTISRYHARIEREDKAFFLEDLNSTNGTYVNEEPLEYKEKRKLKTNDMIRFADVKYRFV
jgi:hypothetical protein